MGIEEVKKQVIKIVTEELRGKPYSAFFFGSRISGKALPTSDLDLGIEGENGTAVPLDILHSIKARCEAIRTLYTLDVVDFTGTSKEFREVAKAHTEKIL